MGIHHLFSISAVTLLLLLCTAHSSSDTCSSVPEIVTRATTTTEQLNIATSLLDRTVQTGTSAFKVVFRRPTLNSTFRRLARSAGVKESPIAFNAFTRAIQEISIAKTEACTSVNVTKALSKTQQLILKFQHNYRNNSAGKDLRLLRSIIGKLLCIDSLEPQETPSLSPRPRFIHQERPSTTRTRRQSGCPPRDKCKCPSDGILGNLLCTCEFFACLDQGNVVRDVIFGLNQDECIVFVIDTTGSMSNEINLAKQLILQFARAEEEIGDFGCYILVPFNDVGPDHKIVADESVGPITIAETGIIGDLQDFYKAVQALEAGGGFDAPEYSLHAMLEGLRARLHGTDYVFPGSQMVVITDATSKQPELKNEVIKEANARGVCVHFFLSAGTATNDDIYRDIARETSGNLINEFSDWQLATFTQSYRENPCRHVQQRIGKRQATLAFSRCRSFNISEFSISLQTTLQPSRGGVVTITRPNRTRVSITVRQGNVGIYTEANPTPGRWRACVNTGSLQIFQTSKLLLDTVVVYINQQNNVSVSAPTASCARGKIAVITPQARRISNAALQFVNAQGAVQHTVALDSCNGVLASKSLTFPRGSFTYRIAATDSHGTAFIYDTQVDATFAGCAFTPYFNLSATETSDVTLRRLQVSTIKFELSGNASRPYYFNLSSPLVSELRTRISPSRVTVNSGQSVEISVLVTISSSRVSPGTTRTVTLIASSDDHIVVTATRRTVVENTEETNNSCGCRNGGRCTLIRGRQRCRCTAGYRGRKCELRV